MNQAAGVITVCRWVLVLMLAWLGLRAVAPVVIVAWGVSALAILAIRQIFRALGGSGSGGAIHDISALAEDMTRLQRGYDPIPYIQKTTADQVFLGLRHDQGRRPVPVQVPISTIRKNHIQLLGVSGTGKSSLAGLMLGQCWARGDAVVIFDPKNDRNLPHVLATFAGQKRQMHVIDLSPDQPPQLNPLAGAPAHQVEELLNAALGLDPSGDPAVDFHRGEDRDASMSAAKIGAASIPELVAACSQREDVTGKKNFWRELRQLAELPAFATRDGLDLATAIANGDCIYIVGSADSQRVIVAQRLLLQRILQLIKNRPREEADKRPVMLMLDELKYLLSNSALRAAGTVRDRNCHLLVAHQSLQDLEDCGGLPAQAVIGAIHGNTAIKFVYRVLDTRTAKEFSDGAGKDRVWSETTAKRSANGGRGDGSWREAGRERIPVEMLTSLPKPEGEQASVAVVFGLPPAFLLSTRWLAPRRLAPGVVAAPPLPDTAQAVTSGQDLI